MTFGGKVLHGGRRWDRVERHVHDGGYASGRSRTSARPEALPIRPPRLVKVHMRTGGDTRVQGWELRHMGGCKRTSRDDEIARTRRVLEVDTCLQRLSSDRRRCSR